MLPSRNETDHCFLFKVIISSQVMTPSIFWISSSFFSVCKSYLCCSGKIKNLKTFLPITCLGSFLNDKFVTIPVKTFRCFKKSSIMKRTSWKKSFYIPTTEEIFFCKYWAFVNYGFLRIFRYYLRKINKLSW